MSRWKVPTAASVLGGIALFVGMFGLVIFAALVQPMPRVKPPLISLMALWAFGILMISSGFLSATSFFFDWPIPLRSQLFPRA